MSSSENSEQAPSVTSPSPTSGKRRQAIVLLLMMITLLVGATAYGYWRLSPQYALLKIKVAIETHDRELFHEYVDLDTLISRGVDGFLEFHQTGPVQSSPEAGGTQLASGLITMMKPTLVEMVKGQVDQMIEGNIGTRSQPPAEATDSSPDANAPRDRVTLSSTGKYSSGAEAGTERARASDLSASSGVLKGLLSDTSNFFGPIQIQAKEGKITLATRLITPPRYYRPLEIRFKMRQVDWHQQLVEIENIRDIVQTIARYELPFDLRSFTAGRYEGRRYSGKVDQEVSFTFSQGKAHDPRKFHCAEMQCYRLINRENDAWRLHLVGTTEKVEEYLGTTLLRPIEGIDPWAAARSVPDPPDKFRRLAIEILSGLLSRGTDIQGTYNKMLGMARKFSVRPEDYLEGISYLLEGGFPLREIPIVSQAITDVMVVSGDPGTFLRLAKILGGLRGRENVQISELLPVIEMIAPAGIGYDVVLDTIGEQANIGRAELIARLNRRQDISSELAVWSIQSAIARILGGPERSVGTLTHEALTKPWTKLARFYRATGGPLDGNIVHVVDHSKSIDVFTDAYAQAHLPQLSLLLSSRADAPSTSAAGQLIEALISPIPDEGDNALAK